MATRELDQLLSSLRAEGAVDSEGRFTLDREQARAKMQKFQLVDARRYVLELVQAAVARGASKIEFNIDADDMRMRFDGEVFVHAELDDLYGSLFSEGDTPALRGVRQLALALNAALGTDPKFIELRSGAVAMRMVPGASDQISVREPAIATTELHVRQRLRAQVFVDFFLNITGLLPEEQYLRARCIYASVPVFLDGKQVSVGLELAPNLGSSTGELVRVPITAPEFRAVLTIVEQAAPCELRLVKDGVWIETRELPKAGTNLVAVVEGDALRKDVSQARIVADAALARIEGAIQRERWTLWKTAADRLEGPTLARIQAMVRAQLLEHASLAELDEHRDARTLSTRYAWSDCRDPARRVSLRTLVKLAVAGETPRYARAAYPELAAGDERTPIILLDSSDRGERGDREIEQLSRVLGVELVCADIELSRERRRVLGHQAWRERRGRPALPNHLSFVARGPIRVELPSGPVRGEVGVDAQGLESPDISAPLHLFMYKEGCLLGRAEINIELPGLWLALDAGFEPNEDYSDAQRDKTFIQVFLRGLASLGEPLAKLLQAAAGHAHEPIIRGLIKRWLITLVDPKAQVGLLTRAGVDLTPGFRVPVAELLPNLLSGCIGALPLLETLAGPRCSLAQLRDQQVLEYVAARPQDRRLVADDVLLLGPGDRKLLRAVFGDGRLREWDAGPKRRELEFYARANQGVSGRRRALAASIASAGQLSERWMVELPEGPTRGFVMHLGALVGGSPNKARSQFEVELRHLDRALCTVTLDGVVGPCLAVVEHPDLRPNAAWDDVVRDAAFDEVMAAVRRGYEQIFVRVCQFYASHTPTIRAWIAPWLVHGAAHDRVRESLARELELLGTVDGQTLSLAGAAAVIAAHGKLEFVGRDVGSAPLSDPPVVVADAGVLADLRALFGDALVDGRLRVQRHEVFDKLDGRPSMTAATLEPGTTWVNVVLPSGDGQHGELGIASDRREATLELRLGTAGREIGVVHESHAIHLPLDAVVIDENLPLDAKGQVEARSKRVRVLVRQCRRRIPELIIRVCERWPELPERERAALWWVLATHMRAEANQERRLVREQAYQAAAAVPGFSDVTGARRSLAQVVRAARHRPLDVLVDPRFRGLALDLPALDRPIVLADPTELECLRAHVSVVELDERWDAELAGLRRMAAAAPVVQPDLQDVALASRSATVAGGLQCTLWLPRDMSSAGASAPAASVFEANSLEWVFARAERELDRRREFESLPSAGIITGDGLALRGGAVELDERQRSSLARQLVVMYSELADAIANGRVPKRDHERALEYLAWADHRLAHGGDDEFRGLGKRYTALSRALDRVVPPTLRDALNQRAAAPAPEPEPPPAAKAAPVAKPRAPSSTPEQRLFAAVYEQLAHWARANHYALLTNITLEPRGAGTMVSSEGFGLVFNGDHPIIRRLLAQQPHDPFDLAFVVAAAYSLLNYQAEAISDDDERSFVAQLAESLALSVRAAHRNPHPRSSGSG